MRRLALVLSLCVVLAPRAASEWSYAASDHFEVYTTGGDRRAREALVYFERVHAFFTDFMKMAPKTAHPTRLVIFSGEREFKPFRLNEAATAYFRPGPDRDYIVMRSFDADAYPIVVHEYVHLAIRHSSGAAYPVWLNEGLAEFFSTLEAEGSNMGVGHVPIDRLRYINGDGVRLLPLDRLFAVDHNSPEYTSEAHAGVFYSESWALVHMLMTDARYRPRIGAFIDAMGTGADMPATLSSVYGKTPAAVQTDLQSYILRQSYTYFLAPYRQPKAIDKMPVRSVDGFEAGLVTANLLAAARDREADARAAFNALAQQKPDDRGLAEARAVFELRHGHRDAALPLMARAVELGTEDPQIYLEYATLLRPVDAARSEAMLARAAALAPEDLDIRLRLASLQLQYRKSADVLATLQPVTHVPPENAFFLFQLLANAHAMESHWDAARTSAGLAAKHARTPDEQKYANDLVKSLDDHLARLAESNALRAQMSSTAPIPAQAPAPETATTSDARQTQTLLAMSLPPVVAVGRITNMICGAKPILEVTVSDGILRLLIDDPLAIRVVGSDGPQVDLQCGKQNVTIRIGYVPAADRTRNTMGNVRLLDFTKKRPD